MTMNQPDMEKIQRAVASSLREHWVLFLVEGAVLVVLGLIAIVLPPIATLAVEILLGWLVASIMYALEHKRELSGRWVWMLASGIVDLIVAAMVFIGLPGTAAWAIGLLVGINLVFSGMALIAMALHAREIDPRTMAPLS